MILKKEVVSNPKHRIKVSWQREGLILFQNIFKDHLSPKEKIIAKELIVQGVPHNLRRKLWLVASGALKSINDDEYYYSNLCELSKIVPSFYEKQIDLDLQRTEISDNEEINKQIQDALPHLRQILICYSIRNSTIGYCQGFNFIALKLYLVTHDEEEAFWIFCKIIEDLLPINYYSELVGLVTDSNIIYGLIGSIYPKLGEYFEKNKYETIINNFLHKWLIGLFTQNLNHDILNYIWDMFLLEGNPIIIQVALALFGFLEDQLLNNTNKIKGLYSILGEQFKTITAKNMFDFYFNNEIYSFDIVQLQEMQKEVRADILKDNKTKPNETIKLPISSINNETQCNKDFPYCIKIDSLTIKKEGIDFLLYKQKSNANIIQDYFFNHCPKEKGPKISVKGDIYEVIVERRKHIC